jgi:DNA-binding NtrC family response regulator
MRSKAILIVDDEFSVRDSLRLWFGKQGYRTEVAKDATEALLRLEESPWDVVILDIKMPGMDGLELQRRIREIDPGVIVIMITAYASVETAVRALKEGAHDYVTKPVDPDELNHLVEKALKQRQLETENVQLREKIEELTAPSAIISESPQMEEVLRLVRSVAETDATVMIRGESGTGKELIAQAIHAGSRRRGSPMVAVNCGALPETLLESELFGHEKGAFTGAQQRRTGRIEMADGGTLFLDEVGTVSPKTQAELLRVLETKEITRLGGGQPLRVDFRTISATNQDLENLIAEGSFREDLYFRLDVFEIRVPPLRERFGDIPLLAEHFLKTYSTQMNRVWREFAADAMALLTSYSWPGNVRELANAVERALVVGTPPTVRLEDLPVRLSEETSGSHGNSLAGIEQAHIEEILQRTGWNIARAAKILAIDRKTLYGKIKKYGLPRK